MTFVEAEVEHLDYVWMNEPRGGQRLAAKARDERRVVGEVLGQQLDRHVALQPPVEREVHGRHASDAEPSFELVAPSDGGGVGHCPLPFPAPGPPLDPPPLPPPLPSPAPPLPVPV